MILGYLIFLYLASGLIISAIVFSYLRNNSDFEIKDLILTIDPDGKNREYIDKALKSFRKKPYTFFTVTALIAVPALLMVMYDDIKTRWKKK